MREIKIKYSRQQFNFRPYIKSFLFHAYKRYQNTSTGENELFLISLNTLNKSELIFSG